MTFYNPGTSATTFPITVAIDGYIISFGEILSARLVGFIHREFMDDDGVLEDKDTDLIVLVMDSPAMYTIETSFFYDTIDDAKTVLKARK